MNLQMPNMSMSMFYKLLSDVKACEYYFIFIKFLNNNVT